MSTRTLKLAAPVVLASVVLAACGSSGLDESENTGVATAAVTNVPSDVGCIEITVNGNRTVDRKFDVVAGASSILALSGLPVGSVTFLGQAYSGACSGVGATTVPTWVSDPVTATLVSAIKTNVTLALKHNGTSTVSVDFEDGSDAGTVGTCSAPQMNCAGKCVDTTTDPSNCGSCGMQCVAGSLCASGTCVCPAGTVTCAGSCANTATSTTNCGACGHACAAGQACVSGMCMNAAPTCNDGVKNGTETGVDCGGNACQPCATGVTCLTNADCLSSTCVGGVCH
jgi:hypothetical protein